MCVCARCDIFVLWNARFSAALPAPPPQMCLTLLKAEMEECKFIFSFVNSLKTELFSID